MISSGGKGVAECEGDVGHELRPPLWGHHHGPYPASGRARYFRFAHAKTTTSVAPVVRVPWLDPGIIMKMLDAGACGIICPIVNTRADAERFVSAMCYPPQGSRSFGPIRALLHAGTTESVVI